VRTPVPLYVASCQSRIFQSCGDLIRDCRSCARVLFRDHLGSSPQSWKSAFDSPHFPRLVNHRLYLLSALSRPTGIAVAFEARSALYCDRDDPTNPFDDCTARQLGPESPETWRAFPRIPPIKCARPAPTSRPRWQPRPFFRVAYETFASWLAVCGSRLRQAGHLGQGRIRH
jgi:hypothetical protein